MITRRRLVILAAIVVVGVLVAAALRPSPIEADIVTVARGSLRVTLDEEGETRVRDRFMVSAPVAGQVLRIELEPGDPVTASQTVLATFRPQAPALLDVRARAELEARATAAEASLNGARAEAERTAAELAQAERELGRSSGLARAGAIAPERLESAELAVKTLSARLTSARASVRAADAALREARAALISPTAARRGAAAIQLRSPVDGVVLRRLHESEAVVGQGEALVEVGDLSHMEIVADYLSADAVQVRSGQTALIERWGGGAELTGSVRRVEPSGFTKVSALGVEEQRVNVVLDFEQPNEALARLGDRYRVEVRIVIWEANDVVKAPIGSLVRQGDRWSVFTVRDGRAVRTEVRVGQRNDAEAQVLSGVERGAQVIAFPSDDIEDGVAVKPRNK